eukprot:14458381-Alexandrium_andersonii.AAC.1
MCNHDYSSLMHSRGRHLDMRSSRALDIPCNAHCSTKKDKQGGHLAQGQANIPTPLPLGHSLSPRGQQADGTV